MTDDFAQRHHDFEGCFNFRDVGGYKAADGSSVRWGRLFRAGRQERMTSADLERVKALGIRTQIDLRRDDEIAANGPGPLADIGARYLWLPVLPPASMDELNREVGTVGISGERYLAYFHYDAAPWRQLFETLADEASYPLVVHCTAGKDRTGVSIALTLAILGVARSVIEADYALTNRDVERQVDFIAQNGGLPSGMSRAQLSHLAGVPPDAIGVYLDGVEAGHGSVPAFLESLGVGTDVQDRIRRCLLE